MCLAKLCFYLQLCALRKELEELCVQWLQGHAKLSLGSESRSVVSDSLRHQSSPSQNTGVGGGGAGTLSLLQGIFPTQGSKPGLPQLQADSLPAEPQAKAGKTSLNLNHPSYSISQVMNTPGTKS